MGWARSFFFLLVGVFLVSAENSRKLTPPNGFEIQTVEDGFDVTIKDNLIIRHRKDAPFFYGGKGETKFSMHMGNFDIKDKVYERVGFTAWKIEEGDNAITVTLTDGNQNEVELTLETDEFSRLEITVARWPDQYDRAWMRVAAEKDETVHGGGEQYSSFNLRGSEYPIWVREQGVGRDQSRAITFMAQVHGKGAGGDYYTTYFPQPTFISSRHYYCHVGGSFYMSLDFTNPDFHELFVGGRPSKFYFNHAETFSDLVIRLTYFFKRQPLLPDWVSQGTIFGVQGGTERVLGLLEKLRKSSLEVVGLWIQDWSGKIFTNFGKRVFWNWEWNPEQYPNLDKEIIRLRKENVRFLAYINPHFNKDGRIYHIANEKGYLVKNPQGETYDVDFGQYICGTVDFTNPEAAQWYKDTIIKKNLIDLGFGGWMADFSEYMPDDAVYFNGKSGREMHNHFPVLFAKANREAIEEAGKLDEIMYFMRAGFSGTQEYAQVMWAGDQNVEWSYKDGLASTVPAALSLGLSGFGATHFDIGGYTGIAISGAEESVSAHVNMVRTEELLLRGAEAAVFTPVFRSHEGNLPTLHAQIYDNPTITEQFSVYCNMFRALANYTKSLQKTKYRNGLPLQRPLMLQYEDDPEAWNIEYQYLYGEDLLVAPVLKSEVSTWDVFLPADNWVSIYDSSKQFNNKGASTGTWVSVDAPLGRPPVFYREGSEWTQVFQEVGRIALDGIPNDSTFSSRLTEEQLRSIAEYKALQEKVRAQRENTQQCEKDGGC